jgi:sn-glycerol 3-phosphate transport system ATP-binding protein/multiple sugar transport system ATP-binding protein
VIEIDTNEIALELKDVVKTYHKVPVITQLNLQIKKGEFMVLLGPSGCGKSTTLRLIAGLEAPTAGEIRIAGTDRQSHAKASDDIAMVFQDYALYPNMTVYQNLDYALKVHKVPKAARQQRLTKILATLNLTAYQDRLPGQLSGGQKQRVALGRGLAKKSPIFLLDEPLSNIDVQLREKARDEIQDLHQANGQTIVYVTHDQLEAMALGDRIAIMNAGKIQMVDTPDNIYNHPANLFVAQFVGTPQINILAAQYQQGQLQFQGQTLPLTPGQAQALAGQGDQGLDLGIRPEHVLVHSQPAGQPAYPAQVTQIIDYGRYQQLTLAVNADTTLKAITTNNDVTKDTTVYLTFAPKHILLFDHKNQKNIEK